MKGFLESLQKRLLEIDRELNPGLDPLDPDGKQPLYSEGSQGMKDPYGGFQFSLMTDTGGVSPRRRAEAAALGVTGAERDAITNNLLQPQQAAMRSRDAQYAQLLGAGGTSQAAFNQLRNIEQAEQAQAAQAARDVELLNQQEARRQQAELQQLDRQRAAQIGARQAAIAQTIGGIVGGGFDVLAENLAKSEKDFALDQKDLEALGFDNQQQLLGALRYLQRFGFQGGGGGQ